MWFEKTSTWQDLSRLSQKNLGTINLVRRLEGILSDLTWDLMSARCAKESCHSSVPELGTQIRDLIESTNQELAYLGKPQATI